VAAQVFIAVVDTTGEFLAGEHQMLHCSASMYRHKGQTAPVFSSPANVEFDNGFEQFWASHQTAQLRDNEAVGFLHRIFSSGPDRTHLEILSNQTAL
jgi:hypothetical protein